MVRSESADEDFLLSSGKASGNDEDDEYVQWAHSARRASSSCRGGEDETPPNGVACSMAGADEQSDRRLRRQIANCNERRRMQSINAGFQSLRALLPKRDGEKMSKAAILQHTAELIQSLQADKMRLIEEKEAAIQAKKRKIEEEEARERGLVDELTIALEQERRLRQLFEQQLQERRASSPMLSPVSSTHPHTLAQSLVDSPILRSRPDISGLMQHSLALDSLVGNSAAYLRLDSVPLRAPSGCYTTAPISVDCGGMSCAAQQHHQHQQHHAGAGAAHHNHHQPNAVAMVEGVSNAATPLLMNAMENHSAANLSHRNLNAILEAIRHLEGGGAAALMTTSPPPQPPPPPPAPQHSNVLVR